MAKALLRIACLYGAAAIVSGLYAVFVSHLGLSFTVASNAFWGMAVCSFFAGFVASVRLPIQRRPRISTLLVILGLSGLAIFRSSPEGFLLFGVTPLANSWVPPLLSAAAGALAGAEISR